MRQLYIIWMYNRKWIWQKGGSTTVSVTPIHRGIGIEERSYKRLIGKILTEYNANKNLLGGFQTNNWNYSSIEIRQILLYNIIKKKLLTVAEL